MKREIFDSAAGLVERMDKLEQTILSLHEIQDKKHYVIMADNELSVHFMVELMPGEIATEIFVQDILEFYINTLNLELEELRKNFEEI